MSTLKTRIDEKLVSKFLKSKFPNAAEITFIQGGQLSQAFSYRVVDDEYIIRFRGENETFEKEKSVLEVLYKNCPNAPLPRIQELGTLEDKFYIITNKCKGKMAHTLSSDMKKKIRPVFIKYLYQINQVDISNTTGYGFVKIYGKGDSHSWEEYMKNYVARFVKSLLDMLDNEEKMEFVRKLDARINELLPYASEDRSLIHGDYGFHNVVVDDGIITGILDWELVKYGDFVYDIAWLEFWGSYDKQTYLDAYHQIYQEKQGKQIENYDQRVEFYMLCVGLHMMEFSKRSQQKEFFMDMLGKTKTIFGE